SPEGCGSSVISEQRTVISYQLSVVKCSDFSRDVEKAEKVRDLKWRTNYGEGEFQVKSECGFDMKGCKPDEGIREKSLYRMRFW
ncbi:MAG: hypothetical protein SWZ49_03690, partial [Cyanobacteriota bacterium]|nr:hypothetical protein [Cyanobacteriota bacterium]